MFSSHLVLIIAICYEDVLNLETVAKLNCPHFFCMDCIRKTYELYVTKNPPLDRNGNRNIPYEI